MWVNALAFAARGQLQLAYALAREVRKAAEEEIADHASKLMEILRSEGVSDVPPLQDKWKLSATHVIPHAALLLAVPIAIFILAQVVSSGSASVQGTPLASIAPPPSSPNEQAPGGNAVGTEVTVPTCSIQLDNSAVLTDNANWTEDKNKLEIQNGSGGDAIIKIRSVDTGSLLVSFLVKKDMTGSYSFIPDGSYRIQYAFGGALDQNCTSFVKLTGAGEFPGENSFTTTDNGTYIESTRLSFTLYSVPFGNVRPSSISAEQFNAE